MRYVDLESLRGTPGFAAFIESAEKVAADVEAEDDPKKRRAIIDANHARWKAFRAPLETLLGQKCWYTESRNPGTDDDVDHFRPKGGVAECKEHGGYWWLAFDWRNYRLSCHRSNRLRRREDLGRTHGKGEHFPLLVEQDRWMAPADAYLERPSLLDPADPADPPMLTYSIDGTAALHPAYDDDADARRRLEASRLYLHLDSPAFVEDRASLYGTIATKVEKLDRLAADAFVGDEAAKQTLKDAAQELIRLTRPQMPYSRAAEAYIHIYRNRDWVQKFVLNNLGPVA